VPHPGAARGLQQRARLLDVTPAARAGGQVQDGVDAVERLAEAGAGEQVAGGQARARCAG
jgi:hypothetical protein